MESGSSTARSTSSETSQSSSSSSSDEDEEYVEIDEMKQRLAQMKRNNRGKGSSKILVTTKLMAKFGNVLTPEQRALKNTADRIEKGVRDVLKLHSPTELSAICGLLQLKTLQRGDESIELLINYCKDEKETKFTKYSEYKVNRLCNNMWEGALFEYLKMVGHPQEGILTEPKFAVMKMWRDNGFTTKATKAFTPHYIQRHVLTRHDADQEPDILSRSNNLKKAEKAMKEVERELFEEHDYTNALLYFQQLGNVRTMETDFRDYMITQLEIARAENQRATSNAKLGAEMLEENESRYLEMVHRLQRRAACVESAANHEFDRRFQADTELANLRRTVMSYAAFQRQERDDVEPLHALHKASKGMQQIGNSLREYKSLVDFDIYNYRREIVRRDEHIAALNAEIAHMKVDYDFQVNRGDDALAALAKANGQVRKAAKTIVLNQVQAEAKQQQAWQKSVRWASRCHFLEKKIARLRTMVCNGIKVDSPMVVSMVKAVNNVLDLVEKKELGEMYETARMECEDKLAHEMRVEDLRLALLEEAANAKKGKKKKAKKGAKKGKGKGKGKGGAKGKGKGKAAAGKKSAGGAKKATGKAGKVSAVKKKKKK